MLGKYTTSSLMRMQMQMTRSISIASVSRADLLASKDTKWVGQYVKAVATAGDETHAGHVDEYFRKNFRKLDHRQALDILEPMGDQATKTQAQCLDGSFWTWETLETAVRGNINQYSEEELGSLMRAFGYNYKGSKDLIDEIQKRICLEHAEIKM